MLSTVASGGLVEATQISLTLIGVGVLVALTVGTVKSARLAVRLRRRWRLAMGDARRAPIIHSATSSTWWLAQHDRQRMWRAVTRAEQAVRAAVTSDMAVGDLPSLTRQLRATAEAIDAGLAPGAIAGDPGRDLHQQARELTKAANDIVAVAGSTIAGETRPRTDRVIAAIRVELEAVRHGRQAGAPR